MTLVVVDVEADGPCPGLYSMIELGAVIVEPALKRTFYCKMRPLEEASYLQSALDVTGHTREATLEFPVYTTGMTDFGEWIQKNIPSRPVMCSDNIAFDWQFVNYYFHLCHNGNPFGFSGRRIADMFGGLKKDLRTSWKKYRITPHTHHPVDDAKGNAEALLWLANQGVKGIL